MNLWSPPPDPPLDTETFPAKGRVYPPDDETRKNMTTIYRMREGSPPMVLWKWPHGAEWARDSLPMETFVDLGESLWDDFHTVLDRSGTKLIAFFRDLQTYATEVDR